MTKPRYDPQHHHRRSIRLKGYDYAQAGAYFVTLCVQNRECALGYVVDGGMVLNDAGQIVQACWDDLPNHYPHIQLDAFVVMPNHVHGIIVLVDDVRMGLVGAGLKPAPTTPAKQHGLPEIVRAFKTFSARRINLIRGTPGQAFWQCNYYERVIRDEAELDRARRYIETNPAQWQTDTENPDANERIKR
ncbi:MAG: transposase [Thermoflexales bacterium]|nr:transposase [Thermoflexales bacterium]